ncbi:hypothetical protein GOV13_05710 [Candidatus Pacearchaeota archaeon]|nr:hypothetical protein [Candidatus Pacearchaeota archaeon]
MSRKWKRRNRHIRRHERKRNNLWIWIIIVVLIGFVLAYTSNIAINLPSVFNSSSTFNFPSVFSSLFGTSNCEKEAEKLIPSTILVSPSPALPLIAFEWNDGTLALGIFESALSTTYCKKGSKVGEGENVCYVEGSFEYNKKVVKDGTIIGYNEFVLDDIVLIIPPQDIDEFRRGLNIDFPVHDYKIKNCKWAEDIKLEYSRITEEYYQKQQQLVKDWSNEKDFEICASLFGKENIGSYGGIPKNDYTVCGVDEGETFQGISTSTNHYVDIFTLKEISEEEVKRRRVIWQEFYVERGTK